MVAISITLILAAIGTAAAVQMTAEARKSQVRSMLEGLKGVHQEFQFLQKNSLNISGTSPIDWSQVKGSSKASSIERFVYVCQQNEKLDTMMQAAIKSSSEAAYKLTFTDNNGNGWNEINDRWRTPIEFRPYNNDGKGTGPGTNIANNKLPITQSAFFVSAGKDKEFGTEDDISTEDN